MYTAEVARWVYTAVTFLRTPATVSQSP
uniref:Uncharacterized protein n=1 Tax=Anguilla anguilla TaxID=7936 RepID=A0A0E9VD15_ANGAN